MKKFAVFDIDGTLFRWQLYHELVETLAAAGVFARDVPRELTVQFDLWKSGEISFREYEQFVVGTMTKNLPLISVTAFETACDKVVAQSAHKTHYYVRSLLKDLKKQGYVIVAITGSQQELADRFSKRYGFDTVVGVTYERRAGYFTGKTTVSVVGKKPEILRKIVQDHGLSWADSVAIGDSVGDANLLELVEQPIAFNPDAGLFERAKSEGWPIVIERKNIAYKLEKKGDEIILADTIIY